MAKALSRLSASLLVVLLAACGGGSDSASTGATTAATTEPTAEAVAAGEDTDATEATAASTAEAEPEATEATEAAAELPAFLSEFERVCTTQVGYGGAAPFSAGPGPHPIALLEEFQDDGGYLETARQLPAGWAVVQDSDFADNSELAGVQLVGCLEQLTATPNGTMCEFDSEGQTITLELVDGTFELRVYAAATGEEVGVAPLTAAGTECPLFATFQEGDTTYFNTIPDEDVINALKPHVAP